MSSYRRTILVTGSNTGIGYALVRLLAQKGHNVYLASRNDAAGKEAQAKLKSEDNLDVKYVQLDITDVNSVQAAKKVIESAEGKLDVLVNNAATSSMSADKGPYSEDLSPLRDAFEVNFFGTVQVTTAFLPLIRKAQKGYGVIQFVSTEMASTAFQASPKGILHQKVAYNASKAALNNYVVSLAKLLKDEESEIKVNCITPGFTTTQLNGFMAGGQTTEEGANWLVPLALLGPEDSATTGKFFRHDVEFPW